MRYLRDRAYSRAAPPSPLTDLSTLRPPAFRIELAETVAVVAPVAEAPRPDSVAAPVAEATDTVAAAVPVP